MHIRLSRLLLSIGACSFSACDGTEGTGHGGCNAACAAPTITFALTTPVDVSTANEVVVTVTINGSSRVCRMPAAGSGLGGAQAGPGCDPGLRISLSDLYEIIEITWTWIEEDVPREGEFSVLVELDQVSYVRDTFLYEPRRTRKGCNAQCYDDATFAVPN